MKNRILVITILFLVLQLKAQDKSYHLIDSITKDVVPYASVSIPEKSTGTYSSIHGNFEIQSMDSLIKIYCLGYKTETINLNQLSNDTILLQPTTYNLNEIVIKPPEKKEKIEIGYFKNKHNIGKTNYPGGKLVVFIPNTTNFEPYIEDVIIGMKTKISKLITWKVGFTGIYKVNIYAINIDSLLPDSSLLKENLIFTTDNLQEKTTINISKHGIKFPKNGIFIGVEWVGIQNSETGELITMPNRSLGPWISCSYKPKGAITYEKRSFNENRWTLITESHELIKIGYARKIFTPRISLTFFK